MYFATLRNITRGDVLKFGPSIVEHYEGMSVKEVK